MAVVGGNTVIIIGDNFFDGLQVSTLSLKDLVDFDIFQECSCGGRETGQILKFCYKSVRSYQGHPNIFGNFIKF